MEYKANLIEPGVKFFFKNSLNECRKIKDNYYNIIFNTILGIVFILICTSILYFKYKGHITPEQKRVKAKKEKEYIMSKLIQLSDYKRKSSQNLITDLPDWSNNPETVILNRKISI